MLTIPRAVWDAVWSNQERICFEDYRLSTFMCLNWLSVSDIRLAASGFYYDAILDDIICFSCGICKRDWCESETKVAILHLDISKECLHANFCDNRNVPAISGSTYPSIPSSNDFELTPSMQFGIPEENESTSNDDGTSEEQMTPRTLSSARFSSLQTSNLQNHSDHVEYNEEIRSDAGQESTIEATANGRIIPVPRDNQTQPGDTLDEENARLQNQDMPPDKAARRDQAEESLKANQHDGEFQENMILIQDSTKSKDNGGSEPEQCILDMRRAASPEKASVSTRLSTFGDWPGTGLPSARSLVIAGFYYMESQETRGQGNSPSQTTELATKLEQVKKPSDTTEATNSDEPPMPDHQFLRKVPLCIVCSERSADTIFLPCRHVCTCEVCADSLSQCCLCRDRIRGTAHMFILNEYPSL